MWLIPTAYKQAHVLNCMYCRKSNVHLLNRREIRTRAHDGPLLDITIPLWEAYKRGVGYFGAIRWNELLPNIHKTNTYLEFKQLQKKEMFRVTQRKTPTRVSGIEVALGTIRKFLVFAMYILCFCVDFICIWYPTQIQFPVVYGLKS